jgi:cyclophilin family peptidyl-prolyl cis-trans isomerase/HEAT repeat protein
MRSPLHRGLAVLTLLALAGCGGSPVREDPETLDREIDERIQAFARILRAEDALEVDEFLLASISDPQPIVRARAVTALGRIGRRDSVPALVKTLGDEDSSVRAETAFALGLIEDPSVVPALSQAIVDADPAVRAAVAGALGRLRVPEAGQPLEVLLLDNSAGVAAEACLSVWKLDDPTFALETLFQRAGSGEAAVAFAATYALARLATSGTRSASPEAEPARLTDLDIRKARARLRGLATHPSPEVRMQVARGLDSPTDEADVETLGRLLRDQDARVRVNAARSLSFQGAQIQPHVNRALSDPDRQVVATAVEGLGRIRTGKAVEALMAGLFRSEVEWLRAKALAALAISSPDFALSASRRLVFSGDPRVKEVALRILARRSETPLEEDIRLLKAEPVPRFLAASVPLLVVDGLPLEESLGDIRFHDDPGVRAAVARVAGERLAVEDTDGDLRAEALDLLMELWDRSSDDVVPLARKATLDAVAGAGEAAPVRDLLRLGLDDKDPRVRARAKEHLETLFGEIHDDRETVWPTLSLAEYERIVRWSLEPKAARVTVEREGFSQGWFTVSLDTRSAPLTCWNFARLARSGFYDGMEIHRIVPNFVVQAGDPRGDGHGGPGYPLRTEVSPVPFVAGTLGMAQVDGMSHGSQWFIALSAQPHLDGRFTAFGQVVRNFLGAVLQLEPGDRIVSIEVYDGDGSQPPRPDQVREESGPEE